MNTIKQNIKKVARPIYHKVVPEKIRTRRAARLNRSLEYETWITMLEANENYDEKFEYNPKISILVPVYNVLDRHLIPCIESVLNQVYTNWELCLADDCSSWDSVRETLAKYEGNEKIKIVYRTENGHISRCTNSALEIATGEFVAFMDCDDVLRPNALYEVVKKLNENPNLDFIYSDEDKIDDDGFNRHMPHFKPDWSPDTLMSHMYTCHFGVYRRSIAKINLTVRRISGKEMNLTVRRNSYFNRSIYGFGCPLESVERSYSSRISSRSFGRFGVNRSY